MDPQSCNCKKMNTNNSNEQEMDYPADPPERRLLFQEHKIQAKMTQISMNNDPMEFRIYFVDYIP